MQTEDDIRELLKGEFYVDVINFEKHHPKGNTKQFVKLKTDWYLDVKFHGLTNSAQLTWVKLLSYRASVGHLIGPCTTSALHLRVGCQRSDIHLNLLSLWKNNLIFLEKKREDKIREEKKEPVSKEDKTEQEKTPSLPTKTEEISSSPQAGEALFSFEEIPKRILEQYQVTARGIETWVSKWGIEKVSANLVPASHKFEIQANTKNPHFRENFIRYFDNWMDNSEAKATGAKKKKEIERAEDTERKKWTAY